MKKLATRVALAAALSSMTAAQADEYAGSWIGGKIGANRSDITTLDTKNATTYGLEGGHNWEVGNFLLGVDGFADSNRKATHNPGSVNYGSSAYGLDAKLGLPTGRWLRFAKLGYARVNGTGGASAIGDSHMHLGLGLEDKFTPNWSIAGEYTTVSGNAGAAKLNNNNFTVGLNYYFGKTPVASAVPAVEKKTEPVTRAIPAPAPEPVQNETWKTLLENKPVCIEGANFEFDSAKLRDKAIRKLDEVKEFADKYRDAQLKVEGHTDNIGTKVYNQKLSERRAESVKVYLVKRGVATDRITTMGHGKEQPVADNKTAEGRAQNRRVEVCSTIKVEKKVRADQ